MTDSPQRHELHTGEHVLTAPTELLWRQIHPSHVDDGKVSSLAFTPSAKDEGQLSTTRSTKASADEAYAHYTKVRGLSSFGVYAVTVAEVDDQGLRAVDDSGVAIAEPTPGHAYIDFRDVTSANRRKKIAARLRDRAEQRGWQNH